MDALRQDGRPSWFPGAAVLFLLVRLLLSSAQTQISSVDLSAHLRAASLPPSPVEEEVRMTWLRGPWREDRSSRRLVRYTLDPSRLGLFRGKEGGWLFLVVFTRGLFILWNVFKEPAWGSIITSS